MEILYASLIIFAAYFVRSLCGFGGSIIAVPLLALFMGLTDIVVILTLLSLLNGVIVVRKSWDKVDKDMIKSVLIGSVPMVVFGVYLLNSLDPGLLLQILGVMLVLFSINFLTDKDIFSFLRNKTAGFFAGVISGLCGGLFTISGPPMISYLSVAYNDPRVFRATSLAYFFVLNIVMFFSYLIAGNVTKTNLTYTAYLLVALVVASYAGHHVHLKVPEKELKVVIALVMIASGISLAF